MNQETIKQVFFSISFVVAPAHTAPAVFSSLPHSVRYAEQLNHQLCSSVLLAQMQSICMKSLQAEIDWDKETVFATSMELQQTGPATVNEFVYATGYVVDASDTSVHFQVEAHVGNRPVGKASLRFAVAERVEYAPMHSQPIHTRPWIGNHARQAVANVAVVCAST